MTFLKTLLCSFSVFLVISACRYQSSYKAQDCPHQRIPIDLTSRVDQFFLSELIDSIRYVELKSPPGERVGEVKQVKHWKDRFLIADRNNVLFCFDETGNLLYSIREAGKGTGRYALLANFAIDTIDRQVIVYDREKLVRYDISTGEFLTESPSPVKNAWKMASVGHGLLLFDAGYEAEVKGSKEKELFSFLITDSASVTKGFYPFSERIHGKFYHHNKFTQFFFYNDEVLLSPLLIPKVFSLDSNGIHCKYVIDYGIESIPDDPLDQSRLHHLLTNRSDYAILSEVIETVGNLIIYTEINGKILVSVYDKELGTAATFDHDRLINDLANFPVPPFIAGTGTEFISVLYPHSESATLEQWRIGKAKSASADLGVSGNPILAVYFPRTE